MKIIASLVLLLFCAGQLTQAQTKKFVPMDNDRIEKLLKKEVQELEGDSGAWQMSYGGQLVMVITDESANRMRIFSPVIEASKLKIGQKDKMLAANFHTALDAKYSLFEGFVVSVFTHPLFELTEEQFLDALRQVVVLNLTFGETYQSTDKIFNPGGDQEKKEEAPPAKEEKERKS